MTSTAAQTKRFQRTDRSRAARVGALVEELEHQRGEATPGRYNALAVLLSDAALAADEEALIAAQQGLQRVYARQLGMSDAGPEQLEQRGRVLSILDLVTWSLRRFTPRALRRILEQGSYTRCFLEMVSERPGLSTREVAELLSTDDAETQRIGRQLVEAGAVRSRRLGHETLWEVTPRGRDALSVLLSLRLDARGMRRLAEQVMNAGRSGDGAATRLSVPTTILATMLSARRPLSIEELALEARSSEALVRLGAKLLLDRGIIREARGDGEPTGLVVDEDGFCAIGVKIGPDALIGTVTDLRGELLRTERSALPSRDPDTVVGEIAGMVERLRAPDHDAGSLPDYLVGLGVEVGGHVDGPSGTVVFSPHMGWQDEPLRDRLRDATGLRVVVENDVNALAIDELLYGDMGRDFAVVLVHEGVGCGIVIDGNLAHGASGAAGELGHVTHEPGGRRCDCGRNGCIEAYASVPAIVAASRGSADHGPATIEEAAALAASGDPAARRAFHDAGVALGRAVSTVQIMLNPAAVLIAVPGALGSADVAGGPGRATAAGIFNRALHDFVRAEAFSTTARDCRLRVEHVPDLELRGAHGAASTVLQQFVERPLTWRPFATVAAAGVSSPAIEAPRRTPMPEDRSATIALAPATVGPGRLEEDADDDPLAVMGDALVTAMG